MPYIIYKSQNQAKLSTVLLSVRLTTPCYYVETFVLHSFYDLCQLEFSQQGMSFSVTIVKIMLTYMYRNKAFSLLWKLLHWQFIVLKSSF